MKKTAVLCNVLAGVAWGTAGVFVSYLTAFGFASEQLAFARCLTSALLGLIYLGLTKPRVLMLSFRQFAFCAVSGVAFYIMAVSYYSAMKAASVPTASVMLNMAPILVILFSVLFFGERMTVPKAISIAAAVIGCALVTGGIGGLTINTQGVWYGMLSMAAYAVYSICVKLTMRQGVNPAAATVYCFCLGSLTALFFTHFPTFFGQVAALPLPALAALILMGVVTGFGATFLYARAMQGLPAGAVSAMASIEPLTSTVLSIVVLHQTLTVWSGLGIVMILLAVTVLGAQNKP